MDSRRRGGNVDPGSEDLVCGELCGSGARLAQESWAARALRPDVTLLTNEDLSTHCDAQPDLRGSGSEAALCAFRPDQPFPGLRMGLTPCLMQQLELSFFAWLADQ